MVNVGNMTSGLVLQFKVLRLVKYSIPVKFEIFPLETSTVVALINAQVSHEIRIGNGNLLS